MEKKCKNNNNHEPHRSGLDHAIKPDAKTNGSNEGIDRIAAVAEVLTSLAEKGIRRAQRQSSSHPSPMALSSHLGLFSTQLGSSSLPIPRNSNKLAFSALTDSKKVHGKAHGSLLKHDNRGCRSNASRHSAVIEAKRGNPPVMPAVMTPGGPLDLSSVLFRNRIIFIGQPVNSQVAQRVISQLVTLATIDEDADILMYLNCPGGSTYSVLAIYDTMSWIKPKVGTVCFGVAASQGALLLAGGEKGMRYSMPNARIMIHQPQSGCGGHVEDVRRQVNEAVQSRYKIDKMYAAFTGQPLEKVQQYTERDRFFSSSEALEFGLIDGVLETEY